MPEQEKSLSEAEKALGIFKIKWQEFVLHFKKYSFTPEAKEGEHVKSRWVWDPPPHCTWEK